MSTKRRELKDFVFDDSELPSSSQQPKGTVLLSAITLPAQQPRRYFDPAKMEQLIQSVKEHGILENLLIRPLPNHQGQYELVAGERRYRAAQAVGLLEVPVTIRELTDSEAIAITLVENLQREDLNPLEETEGILELLVLRLEMIRDEVISHLNRMRNVCDRYKIENSEVRHNVMSQPQTLIVEELFASVGRMSWESFVKNRLPLLNLSPDVLEALRQGQLEYTKARAIARVKGESTRKQLLEDAITYNLSLSEIKRKIKEIEQQSKSETPSIKDLADDTFRRLKKSNVWDDPNKQAKVEKLLAQLNSLMQDDNPIA
jgi:ParB family transcriptional regulator, chromosome partitioning protein